MCNKNFQEYQNKQNITSTPNNITCDTKLGFEDQNKQNVKNIPSNITCDARDSAYEKSWLTPEYKERLDSIRKKVMTLIELSEQHKTKLSFFTPHGVSHCENVERNMYKLLAGEHYSYLSEHERFYLLASAWLHDLGMYIEGLQNDNASSEYLRNNHHIFSGKIITEKYALLGITPYEVDIFSTLAFYHRKKEDIRQCREIMVTGKIAVRIRLIAAYLRLADALHIDQSRTPPEDHAIALTYNMPYHQKIHWIRSRLVIGLDINADESKITVHLKYPSNLKDTSSRSDLDNSEFERKIRKIYKVFIVQELEDELNSIYAVLMKYGITTYYQIDHEIHNVYFEKNFLKEVKLITKSETSIRKPSSSDLYNSILNTIHGYFVDHNDRIKNQEGQNFSTSELENETLNEINSFILGQIKQNRKEKKNHYMIQNLLFSIEKIINAKFEKKEEETTILHNIMCEILAKIEYYDDIIKKSKKFEEEFIRPLVKAQTKVFSFLDAFVNILLKMYIIDNKLIRFRSATYFATILEDNSCPLNFEKIQLDAMVEHVCNLVHSESYLDFFGKDEAEEDIDNIRKKCFEKNNNNDTNEKPNPENEQILIPYKLGIMLYGFSISTVRTLCGFRDAIVLKVLQKLNDSVDATHNKECFLDSLGELHSKNLGENFIEKIVSEMFEIFVCEGQPKNSFISDRLHYHDGYEYIEHLRRRKFTNIILIPDAVSGTLFTQYYKVKTEHIAKKYSNQEFTEAFDYGMEYIHFPHINFLMIGANGFCEKYIYHTAGHLTLISAAIHKGRTKVIVTMQTDKFLKEEFKSKVNYEENRSIPINQSSMKKASTYYNYYAYEGENIKKFLFTETKENYFAEIGQHLLSQTKSLEPLIKYTPAEDAIRFSDIDTIITEHEVVNIGLDNLWLHGPKIFFDNQTVLKQHCENGFLEQNENIKGDLKVVLQKLGKLIASPDCKFKNRSTKNSDSESIQKSTRIRNILTNHSSKINLEYDSKKNESIKDNQDSDNNINEHTHIEVNEKNIEANENNKD